MYNLAYHSNKIRVATATYVLVFLGFVMSITTLVRPLRLWPFLIARVWNSERFFHVVRDNQIQIFSYYPITLVNAMWFRNITCT